MEDFSHKNIFLENYYSDIIEEIIIKYMCNSNTNTFEKIEDKEGSRENLNGQSKKNLDLKIDKEMKKKFNDENSKITLNKKKIEINKILKDLKSVKDINFTKNSLGCYKLKELLEMRENLKNKNSKKLEKILNSKKNLNLKIDEVKNFKYFFTFRRMKNFIFKYKDFDLLENEINFLKNKKKIVLKFLKRLFYLE